MAVKTLFPLSRHATWWLTDLEGIEIGGAAHNQFGLKTINVDRLHHDDPEFAPYASEQHRLIGHVMPVDVVAPGNDLPFEDKSYDFVISSHVIEHFFDPISALKEWARVARKYIYLIVPQRDALPSDRGRPLTTIDEFKKRHRARKKLSSDEHHSVWTWQTFVDMCEEFGFKVIDHLPVDDKVGNGFTIVIQVD